MPNPPMRAKGKKRQAKSTAFGRRLLESLQQAVDAAATGQWHTLKSRVPAGLLRPSDYSAKDVRQVRKTLKLETADFAAFMGVDVAEAMDWEKGRRSPPGSACRLMDEVRRDPSYWRSRTSVA